jgi:hypothetical protein
VIAALAERTETGTASPLAKSIADDKQIAIPRRKGEVRVRSKALLLLLLSSIVLAFGLALPASAA